MNNQTKNSFSSRPCPFCGNKTYNNIINNVQDFTFRNVRGSWDYHQCSKCKALFISPVPSSEVLNLAYSSYYTHAPVKDTIYQKFICTLKNIKKYLFPYRPSFFKDIKNFNLSSMLDIGCGNGSLLKQAKDLGWNVTGVEMDPLAVEYCNSKGLDVIQGDFNTIKDTNKFDCVVLRHVIEHVIDPLSLIDIALSNLSPSGLLWIQWPNPNSLGLQKYGRYWRGLEAPRHICLPTIQGLVEYIEVKYPQEYTVIDKSRNWLSAAIVMYVESKSAKEGRGAKVNLRPFIAEVFRHSIRRALRTVPVDSSELCTLIVKKNY